MSIKKPLLAVLLTLCGVVPVSAADEAAAAAAAAANAGPSPFDRMLDSMGITESDLQAKANSTKMFGGSSPVSFSGEGRLKAQMHNITSDVDWMADDRNYISSGWEGNESMFRLGMVARAGRNTVLWSKIGFQHTLPGNRWQVPETGGVDGQVAQYPHDKALISANIHEDMNAGIAVRTVPASFWLRMGNVNWIEASPFTIWKAQPRTFAWEYLPYEVEQPIGRYYEYNIANGEKAGRAAWHKKPFNGINFESVSLPARLYLNIAWAAFERYDNFEPEYVDFSNDLALAGQEFPLKGTGIGDSYRHIFHTRLAVNKLFGELTPALNFIRLDYNDDVITAQDDNGWLFLKAFDIYTKKSSSPYVGNTLLEGTAFYKEPKVFSVDLRGPFANRLFDIHTDLAFGQIDTTYLTWKPYDSSFVPNAVTGGIDTVVTVDSSYRFTKNVKSSAVTPAFYTRVNFNGRLPLQLDVAFIGKGFYSPLSFAAPQDAFYAFNSNMVGSGKFIGRGEASPYVQNMAGALLTVLPKIPGYGHLRFAYGQHAQVEPGRDILYFPSRLNGLDFFSFWHSTYSRWGNGYIGSPDWTDKGRRLGNESFASTAYLTPLGMEAGGCYTDYLSTFYSFVPWDDAIAASRNFVSRDTFNVSTERTVDSVTSSTAFVPVHRKFTNNIEVDVAYDISHLLGYPNDLFVGGYAALNNVATAFTPLAVNSKEKNTQLWSVYLRFEPAIALTKKFYLLGILGFENWRARNSMMAIAHSDTAELKGYLTGKQPMLTDTLGRRPASNRSNVYDFYRVPIDFRDAAAGLGFDWEILSRVGLHGRFKYIWHKDVNFTYNNWGTPVASLEIKTWF